LENSWGINNAGGVQNIIDECLNFFFVIGNTSVYKGYYRGKNFEFGERAD
jgi:hypothetical protein